MCEGQALRRVSTRLARTARHYVVSDANQERLWMWNLEFNRFTKYKSLSVPSTKTTIDEKLRFLQPTSLRKQSYERSASNVTETTRGMLHATHELNGSISVCKTSTTRITRRELVFFLLVVAMRNAEDKDALFVFQNQLLVYIKPEKMEGEDAFFAAPPADADAFAAPPAEADMGDAADQGFAFVGGDAAPLGEEAAAPFVGDVNEAPADMGFAGADPAEGDAFAAPPADMDAFAAPPTEDGAIILGAPAGEMPVDDVPPTPIEPSEPSAMKKWNEDWQETLATRKTEEDEKKAEMVEQARLVMEQFGKDREAKREAKMSKNREDEQAKLEAIEADLENDNSWQKVSKMVELTHDGAEDAEDVKRMRDVLILLKNEPSRAEAVGA